MKIDGYLNLLENAYNQNSLHIGKMYFNYPNQRPFKIYTSLIEAFDNIKDGEACFSFCFNEGMEKIIQILNGEETILEIIILSKYTKENYFKDTK